WVIDALAVAPPADAPSDAQVQSHLIFGNTDWDAAALATYARGLGIHVHQPPGRLSLKDAELVFCHGHEPGVMESALSDGVRYLCHGHTHRASDTRQAATRIINPGALFRARTHTVAILDTELDRVQFYPVPDRG